MNPLDLHGESFSRTARPIRAGRIRVESAPVLTGGDPSVAHAMTVTPILDGDVITHLELRCGCGQHMTVVCVYDEADQTAGSSEKAEE